MDNKIEIYITADQETQIEVHFEQDTVWLTQQQMASLFNQTKQNVSLHINNCFKEDELDKNSTVKKSLTVQTEGKRKVTRDLEFYNLDVIISVGYRIKSKRGTQFRQWATKRLKEYLVEGYSINEKRLKERDMELQYLKSGINIIRRSIEQQAQNLGEARELAVLLDNFSHGLILLDDYDHENLDKSGKTKGTTLRIHPDEFRNLIKTMSTEFSSELFGKEKDGSFVSSVDQIYQGFGNEDVYPSVEEKAAMLLYLVVKNHSFVDGNKRIAAACFLYFLNKNVLLYNQKGEAVISNDALASITLFIAESKPEEMQTVKQVILSILNRQRK